MPVGDNLLNSFTLWFDDSIDPDYPEYTDFAAYVMAWDGAKAMGPVLWSSTPVSTTNNGGLGTGLVSWLRRRRTL